MPSPLFQTLLRADRGAIDSGSKEGEIFDTGGKAPSEADFSQFTKLVGSKVATVEGQGQATIADMTMDSSGRLELLILSNVPVRGAHKVVVPFEALKRTNEGALVLGVAEERLALAPLFIKSEIGSPLYTESIDRFFGLAPSWTVKSNAVPSRAASDPYRWGGEAQEF